MQAYDIYNNRNGTRQVLIESGDEYSNLKRSYIIFICLSDPFKKGLPVYVFTKTCKQDRSIELNDEATTVVINVSGSRKGLSPNMAAFLDFVQNQKVSDDFTQPLVTESIFLVLGLKTQTFINIITI